MRHGSLFSGIGGFDLAAEWMGGENVFHCERDEFGQKVLKHYWPNAISYHDITKTDFTIHRGAIDIITGGFPCQPYSSAGKRLGKDDEKHLWPEMLRRIREVSPRWIVGENVRGLTNWNGDGIRLRCVLTWKIMAIKSRPLLYLREQIMHLTKEKESGLMPTPMTHHRNVTCLLPEDRCGVYPDSRGAGFQTCCIADFQAGCTGALPTACNQRTPSIFSFWPRTGAWPRASSICRPPATGGN